MYRTALVGESHIRLNLFGLISSIDTPTLLSAAVSVTIVVSVLLVLVAVSVVVLVLVLVVVSVVVLMLVLVLVAVLVVVAPLCRLSGESLCVNDTVYNNQTDIVNNVVIISVLKKNNAKA